MTERDYIKAALLGEILHTPPYKAARRVAAGEFGPVFFPRAGSRRGGEILVAAIERHLCRELTTAELADANQRYAARKATEFRCTKAWRAKLRAAAAAGDVDAELKLAGYHDRDNARHRALRARLKTEEAYIT